MIIVVDTSLHSLSLQLNNHNFLSFDFNSISFQSALRNKTINTLYMECYPCSQTNRSNDDLYFGKSFVFIIILLFMSYIFLHRVFIHYISPPLVLYTRIFECSLISTWMFSFVCKYMIIIILA